jgi:hypothetical protein
MIQCYISNIFLSMIYYFCTCMWLLMSFVCHFIQPNWGINIKIDNAFWIDWLIDWCLMPTLAIYSWHIAKVDVNYQPFTPQLSKSLSKKIIIAHFSFSNLFWNKLKSDFFFFQFYPFIINFEKKVYE